jgi:DCC-interacting protein 13 alpha
MIKVKSAERGNETIHETIRQVMAYRAAHNILKMHEYNLNVSRDSIKLFTPPNSNMATNVDLEASLVAQIDMSDLAFWSSNNDNERLFGIIIKEPSRSFKFDCLVFESDTSSGHICESITNATQLAYQLLIVTN